MNEGEFLKKVCLNVFASAKRARFVGVVDQDGKLLLGKYRHRSEKDSSALLIKSSIFYSHYLIPIIEKNRDANNFRKSMSYDILEEPCFELVDLPSGGTVKMIIIPLTNRYDRYLCVYLELVPLSCAESIKTPIEHHDKIDSIGDEFIKKLSMILVINVLTYLVPLIFFFWFILDNGMSTSYAQEQQPSEKPQSLVPEKSGVKITYPIDGQTAPKGELVIFGTATHNATTTECTVYADWNDSKPMQKTMPAGMNYTEFGRANDYSTWIFTYTEKSHIISEGTNELTAKLSCDIGPFNSTKYDSVSITGLPGTVLGAEVEEQGQLKRGKYVNSVWICNECADVQKRESKNVQRESMAEVASPPFSQYSKGGGS